MQPRQAAIALGSAAVLTITAVSVAVPAGARTSAREIELHTGLSHSAAFPRAHGHSEYEQEGTKRELDVTVHNIGRLAGRTVTVRVHGSFVGRIHVSGRGIAHREWETEHGNHVPRVSAGDVILVTAPSGRLVASGRYHRGG